VKHNEDLVLEWNKDSFNTPSPVKNEKIQSRN